MKRPIGTNRGHEEGLTTSMSQLRGSAGIGQLSDIVIGVERSVSSEDTTKKTVVRILKNRFAGITGIGTTLQYNLETGRLKEYEATNNF